MPPRYEWTGPRGSARVTLVPRTRIELDLQLPFDGQGPVRAQLERALRRAVADGRLGAGTRLPSSRTLAADLRLSRGVVVDAYAQLVAEGWLHAHERGATTVAASAAGRPSSDLLHVPSPPPAQRLLHDLRPAGPDLSLFPRAAWTSALRHAVGTVPDEALGYPQPEGDTGLRAVLAATLARTRAAAPGEAGLVVLAGVSQGVTICGRLLAADGVRAVAVEDPGHPEEHALLRHAGLEVVPVPVDDRGIDVAALARHRHVGAVLVTPAHQFPSGAVLSAERRAALVAWARAREALILEDDYDAELRYDRQPIGALQGLAPDVVVHLGSVSKALAPALRIGWALAPLPFAARIAQEKRRLDHGAPVVEQVAFARLLESGAYDRHLRRVRRVYRARRDALVGALDRRVDGAAAGLQLVLPLAAGADEGAIAAELLGRGVAVGTLGEHRVAATGAPGLLLGYGRGSEPRLRAAAAVVREVAGPWLLPPTV